MKGLPPKADARSSHAAQAAGESVLSDAKRRLGEGARRRRVAVLTRGLAWSLTAAIAVLAVLELVRGFLPQTWLALQGHGSVDAGTTSSLRDAAEAGVVFVVGAAASAFAALLSAPTLSEMAKAADATFSLRERLSTAVEVDARAATAGTAPLERALLRDAANHTDEIDLRRLVPIRLPRAVWAGGALAALVVLLQFAPPAPLAIDGAGSTLAAASSDTLSEEERAATVENLRQIASQIRDAADQANDSLARAVARTLSDVVAKLDAADTVDRQALVEQLKELLDQSQLGLAAGGTSIANAGGAAPEDLLRSALNRLQSAPGAADGAVVALAERPTSVESTGPRQIVNGADSGPASAAAGAPPADRPDNMPQVGSLTGGSQGEPGNIIAPPHRGPYPVGKDAIDYAGEGPIGTTEAPPQMSATNRGQLAGPANNSRQGDSVLGGLGTQKLNGDNPLADAQIALGDKLILSDDQPNSEGRRIRLESPPQTQLSPNAASLASSADVWRPAPEGEVVHTFISVDRRELVRRYFLPKPEATTP